MRDRDEKRPPRRSTRRGLIKAAGAALVAGVATPAYARWIEPTWVRTVCCDLPVPNLPQEWQGVRAAQVSDLHCGPSVTAEYLEACLRQVRALGPDLVFTTGDFVRLDQDSAYAAQVTGLFGILTPPLGTFACLGNHDYGHCTDSDEPTCTLLAEALERRGVRVLRNESVRLSRGGRDLWLVGLEDISSGSFDLNMATALLPPGAPNLTLCHNPDAADQLAAAGCGAILSGHTHGGQVDLPLWGPLYLPVSNWSRYRGLYRVGRSWLYVNCGLGWLPHVRLFCRPEITLFTLRRAAEAAEPAAAPAATVQAACRPCPAIVSS
jgi:hypothetical protein